MCLSELFTGLKCTTKASKDMAPGWSHDMAKVLVYGIGVFGTVQIEI